MNTRFAKYEAMSFDCYGTLIDWEKGILTQLQAWVQLQNLKVTDAKLIELFGIHERQVQADNPTLLYPDILVEVHHRIAKSLNVTSTKEAAQSFGNSVGDWLVFPDTVEALKLLSKSFKLFIISNVDRASFKKSNQKLGILFDGIVTAQDVGSYKPDFRNFEALKDCVAKKGIPSETLLHVGESIYHDVIPGTKAGLDTVWIDRQSDNPLAPRASGNPSPEAKPTMIFQSMEHLAKAIF